jgi:hypothetical protein
MEKKSFAQYMREEFERLEEAERGNDGSTKEEDRTESDRTGTEEGTEEAREHE